MNISFTIPFNDNDISVETGAPSLSSSSSSHSILGDDFLQENEIQLPGETQSTINECSVTAESPTFDDNFSFLEPQIASTPQNLSFTNIPENNISVPSYPNFIKMDRLAKCSEFSGYTQDNAKRFLTEFESYALLHDLSANDRRLIAAFHLHLKGPALTWFNSLSDESKKSWNTIIILFKEKYINFNLHSPTVIMESEIFQNMVLSPGQSLEDYYSQMLEKAQILDKPEHEIVAKFISGLPEKMAFFVRTGQPVDIQKALTAAKMAEAYGYRQHTDSVNAVKPTNANNLQMSASAKTENKSQDPAIKDLQQQVSVLSDLVQAKLSDSAQASDSRSEVRELREQINALTSLLSKVNVNNDKKPEFRPHDRNPTFSRQNRFETAECRKCNGLGHFQRVCNWNGNSDSQPRATCQICEQKGHTAPSCLKIGTGNSRTPGDRHSQPGKPHP